MFDEMLREGVLMLPQMKHLEEARRVDNPNYCKYHRLVGHPIQNCFVFKDKVMELAKQGRIILEEEKSPANQMTVVFD